jgi:extradiol dioxygenase family protein
VSNVRPFHLAIVVNDLPQARAFYGEKLGCVEGRSSSRWVDFDFFGHQLVCHLDQRAQQHNEPGEKLRNAVDGNAVPVPHFGVILSMQNWRILHSKLEAAGTDFVIGPRIRFEGQPGEQATMFFTDPSGNALEFKAFDDDRQIFEKKR